MARGAPVPSRLPVVVVFAGFLPVRSMAMMEKIKKRFGSNCCVAVGCSMKQGTNKLSKVKLYRFPEEVNRKRLWINAVNRKDWMPTPSSRLCSLHFISGQKSQDSSHPDWIPSVFHHRNRCTSSQANRKVQRYERLKGRRNMKAEIPKAQSLPVLSPTVDENPESRVIPDCDKADTGILENGPILESTVVLDSMVDLKNENKHLRSCLHKERSEKLTLQNILNSKTFYSTHAHSDRKIRNFTSIPTTALYETVFNYLLSCQRIFLSVTLQPIDQLLLTMVKLRHNLTYDVLCALFDIPKASISKLFHEWLNLMANELSVLITWPSKKVVKKNLPTCFKNEQFGKVRCIIDCSEVFIERPTSLQARGQTYSDYKSHNTVKFLIGVSPSGAVTFLSKTWGGRVSDRDITLQSGFLDLIENGDYIMADRGFTISDLLASRKAHLLIPAFTKGKKQLSPTEVLEARKLSNVRIHVERAIGRIKVFKILKGIFPITMLKRQVKETLCSVDKILLVCAALTNLDKPLVKK